MLDDRFLSTRAAVQLQNKASRIWPIVVWKTAMAW
jgi:hypothetical protein